MCRVDDVLLEEYMRELCFQVSKTSKKKTGFSFWIDLKRAEKPNQVL